VGGFFRSGHVRRRVFADFSVANLLRFQDGVATGLLSTSPIFQHRAGCREHEVCKWNVLLHLEEKLAIRSSQVLAVGDSENDVCLLRQAGFGVAFEPKSDLVRRAADAVIHGDLRHVLACAAEFIRAVPA
jgi:phosphoserine phosphatase